LFFGTQLAYLNLKIETWHFKNENPRTHGWTSIDNARRLRSAESIDLDISYPQNIGMYDPDDGTGIVGFGEEEDDGVNRERRMGQSHRELKPSVPEYCEDFKFEWAIDGRITSWNKDEFMAHFVAAQRVVELITLIEDASKLSEQEREVELAIRMTGCGNDKHFKLTHVYWA
jgi:hypothetical protein